jgi:hypothetical protein
MHSILVDSTVMNWRQGSTNSLNKCMRGFGDDWQEAKVFDNFSKPIKSAMERLLQVMEIFVVCHEGNLSDEPNGLHQE